MASKKPKYRLTKNELGLHTGFIQASNMLDIIAVQAIERGDVATMLQVAKQWVEFSATMRETLGPPTEGEEPDDEEDDSGHRRGAAPVGFGVTAKELTDHHARTNKNQD